VFESIVPSLDLRARTQLPTWLSFGVPLTAPLEEFIESHEQVFEAAKLQVCVSPGSESVTEGAHAYATSSVAVVAQAAATTGASLPGVTVTAN
jgi:hypothetical protein